MRYLPHTDATRKAMLERIGVSDMAALFADIPQEARRSGLKTLPGFQGEWDVDAHMSALAAKNRAAGAGPFFIGCGAYQHHVPASVDHLVQRSEFLTAYTPYQPEISQGTLQVLFEFQTQVARLTGMEVANASMYDGSTACAEAVLMACRVKRRKRVVLCGNLHPHYRETALTLGRFSGLDMHVTAPEPGGAPDLAALIDKDTAALVVQNPDVFGQLRDLAPLAGAAHAAGALLIAVVTEPVSLGLLRSPGAMGADIVCGEGQSLGNGLNFGGPYLGLFAVRKKLLRQMPGRICGQTVDADGRRGFVLTLSTREQHIRREKATSNICTNSGLCALAFSIHLSLLGGEGLRKLARLNHESAIKLAGALGEAPGVEVVNGSYFNEFTYRVPGDAAEVIEALAGRDILGGVPVSRFYPGAGLDDLIITAASELNSEAHRAAYAGALKEILS
jgi:glycine dehydrogenase subunit 1